MALRRGNGWQQRTLLILPSFETLTAVILTSLGRPVPPSLKGGRGTVTSSPRLLKLSWPVIISFILLFCVMFVYSSLLSFQTPHPLPRVCSTVLIVCSSPIVCTCFPSPSVFSLCVPVSRCQFVLFPPCLKRPSDSMISKLLVIPTLDRVTDPSSASPLSVPLPALRLPTRVPNLDWMITKPCNCLILLGILCVILDCLTCVPKSPVKVVLDHPCLRVEHLNSTHSRTLQYELARKLDSADSGSGRAALQAQGKLLHQTEEQFNVVRLQMQAMSERQETVHSQVSFLTSRFQQLMDRLDTFTAPSAVLEPAPAPTTVPAPASLPTTAPPAVPPRLSRPERFSGDSGDCRAFLVQCGLHFELNAASFLTERSKVAYLVSYLSGRAEKWATAEWARNSHVCSSVQLFSDTLSKIFNTTNPGREAARALMGFRQGNRRVSYYAIEFRTLATDSGWNDESLFDAFLYGLAEPIKDQLINRELPEDVDSLIALVVKIDKRLQDRGRSRPDYSAPSQRGQSGYSQQSWRAPARFTPAAIAPAPSAGAEEPMQLGRTKLSTEERQRRVQEGRCIYCGQMGHYLSGCPVKDRATAKYTLVSHTTVSSVRPLMQAMLITPSQTVIYPFLVDSGADESFMDWRLAKKLNLKLIPLPKALEAHALDGRLLCRITHRTDLIQMTISQEHTESMSFHLLNSPSHPLILGFPWLSKHNPHMNWATGEVTGWDRNCSVTCIRAVSISKISHSSDVSSLSCLELPASRSAFTSSRRVSLDSDFPDLSRVPSCYLDLKEVFNKTRATSLPPHRPYDCAIDLLPGSSPPRGRLYSLSSPEVKTMTEYIDSSLAAGLIRPSSSPAGAGFFFVAKKDKTLRPCIDYRGLNEITIKNRYPLPLISSAFELLKNAKVFTKLDLRNAYHLVRIREGDEWKTAFNTPSGHYEYLVMPFGLSNAPAVFQALVNDVLRDMLNRYVFVYLDDILIFSPDEDTHVRHVHQVLQRLLTHQLFVKAEKCEFHVSSVAFLGFIVSQDNIQMDPAKVSAVTEWATPTSRKHLQRFLGFANFYRRFIRNFSTIASPLHNLTSSNMKFQWSLPAERAFQKLKETFTTAPVLTLPDPSLQFMVEVDASDVGVGAILSQRSQVDKKLHPCAFLSRKLSPAERNYDVGNRELLAIKVALEEWRHWLEGAEQPFLVWTDHKNLEYIRSAKRLNSRQARWALFFNRFNFSLSYRPGSKNAKADALSHLFDPGSAPRFPSNILPQSCVVGAVTWGVEQRVRQANISCQVPDGCPVPDGCSTSFSGYPLGSYLPGFLSPWDTTDSLCGQTTLLVAVHGGRGQGIRDRLSCLCSEQELATSTLWSSAATARAPSPLV